MRHLVLGGTRSGKSSYAEGLASATGSSVVYVATAPTPSDDAEMSTRIEAHRRRRPVEWRTVESDDVAGVLDGDLGSAVLVDDLGGWVASRLGAAGAWTREATGSDALDAEVDALVDAVRRHPGDLVLVSPEVGLGIVPDSASARLFSDVLGTLNRRLAEVCDRVDLVVAGRPLPLPPGGRESTSATASTRPAEDAVARPAPASSDLGHFDDPVAFPPIPVPAHDVAEAARARHRELTKPAGSLGGLEELGVWVSSCQGQCPPHAIERARVVVFAGDHGVAAHGVSAFPQAVTVQMVANILAGGAAVSVLARSAGASVRVADIAVADDCPGGVGDHKVRRSCGSIDREDALSVDEVRAAVAAGRRIADEEIDSGADLLVAGDLGIGNTTPATVLVGLLTGTEPVAVVGRGTGVDDAGWMRKTAAVRDAMFRCRDDVRDPVELVRRAGGADFAAMAGFLAQAALRRTPVILDGAVVTSAALVADAMAPGARAWWRAGHKGAEPAHSKALDHLGLAPLVDFGMRLGEGSGAVAALPLVHGAVAVLSEMATFADAGVSGKD